MKKLEAFPYPTNRLKEEDLALASALEGMLSREVAGRRLELKEDYEQLLTPALKKVLADIGLQRMFWPESAGGDGHNSPAAAYTVVTALEQVARADTGLAFLCAHNLALQAYLTVGADHTQALVERFAPLFCGGDEPVIVSFILPSFGVAGQSRREWEGKCFQVAASGANGRLELRGESVRPTCSGADANLFVAWCDIEGEVEPALVIFDGDSPGIRRAPEFLKTGLAASPNAEIELRGVKTGSEQIAGRGAGHLRRLLTWYYLGLSATAVGSLLAAYEIIREWGDTRVIKGRGCVFKENPLTASLMAEVAQETAFARMLTYDLAEMLAEPGPFGGDASEGVYTVASMVAHRVYRTAGSCIHHIMELMASAGYSKEWQLERYWRDVKTVQCYLGSSELAKADVARWFFDCRTF